MGEGNRPGWLNDLPETLLRFICSSDQSSEIQVFGLERSPSSFALSAPQPALPCPPGKAVSCRRY